MSYVSSFPKEISHQHLTKLLAQLLSSEDDIKGGANGEQKVYFSLFASRTFIVAGD